MTIHEALRRARMLLRGTDLPWLEAEILLAHCLGSARAHLHAWPERRVMPRTLTPFIRLVRRRAAGEPIAYLIGTREFWSLQLEVNPHTLIPRAETELLVEQALARLPMAGSEQRVADLGTGSGAIALAIASERPRATIVATDVSYAALRTARSNARRHGLERIVFCQSDWCRALERRRFHLIAANPPYVSEDDIHLQRGDLRFEPRSALVAGRNGLAAIRDIIAQAPTRLHADAHLLLEHGPEQSVAVRRLLQQAGFVRIRHYRDLAGNDRVTAGVLGPG